MGNDTALSIPQAVDAGLGELGRNGLLITPDRGPCVRICKVFADMPLAPDRPVRFGVSEFCRSCARCADACQARSRGNQQKDAILPRSEAWRLFCCGCVGFILG